MIIFLFYNLMDYFENVIRNKSTDSLSGNCGGRGVPLLLLVGREGSFGVGVVGLLLIEEATRPCRLLGDAPEEVGDGDLCT